MKTLSLLFTILVANPFYGGDKAKPVIVTHYDEIEDKTTVETPILYEIGGLRNKAKFIALYKGKVPNHPVYELFFSSQSDDWEYLKYHSMRCLTKSSERFSWEEDEANYDGEVMSGGVIEFMHYHLTLPQITALSAGGTCRIGFLQLDIPPAFLHFMTELIEKTTPRPSSPPPSSPAAQAPTTSAPAAK